MDRFIDALGRLHGFSFDAWELQGMCGMAGAVLPCGDPRVHREVPRRAPGPEDVRRLWDAPLRMAEAAEAMHRVRARCAVGVSPAARVEGWERLVDALPGYLENERVAALGEVGLAPRQSFGLSWPLEDQARCLEAQARAAAEAGKPLILRSPRPPRGGEVSGGEAGGEGGGEAAGEDAGLRWLKMSLDVIDGAGLDHALLVITLADTAAFDFAHAGTRARLCAVPGGGLLAASASALLDRMRRQGAGRVLLGSDLRPYAPGDLYGVPRAIRALRRGGAAEADIGQAAFGNANALFGFGL